VTGLSTADHELLLRLLRTPTVNPLEGGEGSDILGAQHAYAAAAAAIGFTTAHHAAPDPSVLDRDDVPLAVRERAGEPGFLANQPSLVLRRGRVDAPTVMFNVHLDTVAGAGPVGFDGTRFTGRGAIDAKGPAVALLAGIRAATPALRRVGVLVAAVAGEEGGAMGTYGTRPLVEAGFTGRLNVFCEPTGLRYATRATAAMTACVEVRGEGSVDDRPDAGHNATVLLGFLAQHLAAALDRAEPDGRVCVAGLHTGTAHNRVYGDGALLVNLSYPTPASGRRLEQLLTDAVRTGVERFRETFGGTRELRRTAVDAAGIVSVRWHKRGLPALDAHDPWTEDLLTTAGVAPWPAGEPAFTCDAIWLHDTPGTVVLGPGCLAGNNAHAEGEFADLTELDAFADTVARVLTEFAARCDHEEDHVADPS
jgi:acetylornithine deacetylase/succinyl-diaminopimelate desuccinylase-like protein